MVHQTQKSLLSGTLVLLFFLAQNIEGAGTAVPTADIKAALASEGYNDISVSVLDPGTVRLEGEVGLLYDKFRIFEIVSRFPAIKKISNEVFVNTEELPDQVIQDNIENELQYIYTIQDPDEIHVNVSEGSVHLTGTVDFYREKLMAQTVVSWQKGVLGCVNDIKIIAPDKLYTDQNIKKMVTGILKNRYTLERQINVNVSNGVITLTGQISNLWAKDAIEKDIHRLVGVDQIIDNMSVM
jgi:osmotically-inducible protein OsmY